MKVYTFYLLSLLSIGCFSEKPISTQKPKNNATYTVEYLFEHDGCKVYRFRDDGHYVYFTSCKGEAMTVKKDSSGAIIKSINSRN